MLNKPCLSCGVLTRSISRCDACQIKYEATHPKRIRASAHRRGYDREWQALSRKVLQRDNHTCGYCGADADTTDHIKPLSTHPELRLVESNLISACRSCNSAKGNR